MISQSQGHVAFFSVERHISKSDTIFVSSVPQPSLLSTSPSYLSSSPSAPSPLVRAGSGKRNDLKLLTPSDFSKKKVGTKPVTNEEKPLDSPADEIARLSNQAPAENGVEVLEVQTKAADTASLSNKKSGASAAATQGSSKYCRENSDIGVKKYPMNKVPRGKCLIISNRYFTINGVRTVVDDKALDDRHGTEIDAEALKETFQWLNFEVEVIEECTADKMMETIEIYSSYDHSQYNGFICCLLSHGFQSGIYGTDGKFIFIEDIRTLFTAEICPTLHGKPKLFFIQACRGEMKDPGRYVLASDGPNDASSFCSTPEFYIIPNDSDFVFANATTPGKC